MSARPKSFRIMGAPPPTTSLPASAVTPERRPTTASGTFRTAAAEFDAGRDLAHRPGRWRGWHARGRRWRSRWQRGRRRWRRCWHRVSPCDGNRNLIALGVHALHVRDVVAALHREGGAIGVADTNGRSPEKTGRRADGRATGRGSDGRPERGADHRADRRARRRVDRTRFIGRGSGLRQCPLPAYPVVTLELLKAPAAARQHHDARARRYRRASREKDQHTDQEDDSRCRHRALGEATVSLVAPARHDQCKSAPSAAKPGPSAIMTPQSPGRGCPCSSTSFSTNRTVAEDRLPNRRRTSRENSTSSFVSSRSLWARSRTRRPAEWRTQNRTSSRRRPWSLRMRSVSSPIIRGAIRRTSLLRRTRGRPPGKVKPMRSRYSDLMIVRCPTRTQPSPSVPSRTAPAPSAKMALATTVSSVSSRVYVVEQSSTATTRARRPGNAWR